MSLRPGVFHPTVAPGGLLAWAGAAAALAFGGPQPLRGAVVLSFGLLGPGLALGRLLRLPDVTALLALACPLSLALSTLGALAMVYTETWSPSGLYLVLSGGVAAGSALELARIRLRPPRQMEVQP